MKKSFLLTLSMFFAIISIALTQQNNQQEIPVYKPEFIVSDIYIAVTILDGVDIKGNEVDAFLEVKNTLNNYLKDAKNKNLKAEDKIVVEIQANIAQNLVTFLSRATLKGNLADAYKRFIDAIFASAKQK